MGVVCPITIFCKSPARGADAEQDGDLLRKKLLSFILALAVVAALVVPCLAAGTPTIEVKAPETLPKKGETFTVTVEIKNNPGINVIGIFMDFDESLVTMKNRNAIAYGPLVQGWDLKEKNVADGNEAIIACITTENDVSNGEIAKYTFTAQSDLTEYPFVLSKVDLGSQDGKKLACSVEYSWADTDEPGNSDKPGKTDEKPGKDPAVSVDFKDIATHWGKANIIRAAELGLFTGFTDGTFRPDNDVTRGQFVTVIWRMAGSPNEGTRTPFVDVSSKDYYAKAVAWANNHGYVNGTSKTTFSPNDPLTREAAMKILFLYSGGQIGAELMYYSVYDQAYTDSGKISSWAKAPMYWGVYNGIISGTKADKITPAGHATRAQLATILVNYIDSFNIEI